MMMPSNLMNEGNRRLQCSSLTDESSKEVKEHDEHSYQFSKRLKQLAGQSHRGSPFEPDYQQQEKENILKLEVKKQRARVAELKRSLQEALKENEELLHDAEELLDKYVVQERKHRHALNRKNRQSQKLKEENKRIKQNLKKQQKYNTSLVDRINELETEIIHLKKVKHEIPVLDCIIKTKEGVSTPFGIAGTSQKNNVLTQTQSGIGSQEFSASDSIPKSDSSCNYAPSRIDVPSKPLDSSVLRNTWHGGAAERTRLGLSMLGVDVRSLCCRTRRNPTVAPFCQSPGAEVPPNHKTVCDMTRPDQSGGVSDNAASFRIEKSLGGGRRFSLNIEVEKTYNSRSVKRSESNDGSSNSYSKHDKDTGLNAKSMSSLYTASESHAANPSTPISHGKKMHVSSKVPVINCTSNKDDASEPGSIFCHQNEPSSCFTEKHKLLRDGLRSYEKRVSVSSSFPGFTSQYEQSFVEEMDQQKKTALDQTFKQNVHNGRNKCDHDLSSISSSSSWSSSSWERYLLEKHSPQQSIMIPNISERVPFDLVLRPQVRRKDQNVANAARGAMQRLRWKMASPRTRKILDKLKISGANSDL